MNTHGESQDLTGRAVGCHPSGPIRRPGRTSQRAIGPPPSGDGDLAEVCGSRSQRHDPGEYQLRDPPAVSLRQDGILAERILVREFVLVYRTCPRTCLRPPGIQPGPPSANQDRHQEPPDNRQCHEFSSPMYGIANRRSLVGIH